MALMVAPANEIRARLESLRDRFEQVRGRL
jgi:hypothetical protein